MYEVPKTITYYIRSTFALTFIKRLLEENVNNKKINVIPQMNLSFEVS